MSGVGKTTAALRLAHRYDLRLYTIDARTHEHLPRQRPDPRSLDEIWVDTTPEELADWFEDVSRERFTLVLENLAAIDDDAPVLVEGPQVLPDLVPASSTALFVVARPDLQRRLVQARGPGVSSRTRDPERAHANRLGRDAILAERLRASAVRHGFGLIDVQAVEETRPAIEAWLLPQLGTWLGREHGDVSARRHDENDTRLRQWRSHVDAASIDNPGVIDLACECETPGCELAVPIGLFEAEAERAASRPLIAPAH
jgi:hypothetical protein